MDDLTPTSPLVPGLGNFGSMITVPAGAPGDDHQIDPTSPTNLRHSNSTSSSGRSSRSSSGSSSSRRKSRNKDRPDSTYAGLSSRDLARILVEEEIRSSHYSKLAQTLSSQLSQQKQRADDAERRATNAAGRLKEETEARARLEQSLKRKMEELKLYQVQLKKAQGEIYKAQDALAEVEKMRDEAEHDAAKARSIARKLREQRLVDIAREEGRRVGLREGLARGQEIEYVDRGYAYLEGGAAVEEVEDDDYFSRTTRSRQSPPPRTTPTAAPPAPHVGGGGGRAPGITDPPDERVLNPMTVTTPLQMPSPESSPPKVSQPVPVPTPEHAIPPRPVSAASTATRSTHKPISIPPDVWIPVSGADGIRLPPPHELSPQVMYPPTLPPQPQPPAPPSPTQPPVRSPNNQPVIIIPPSSSDTHHSDKDSTSSGASYSPVMDRRESGHRRRRSSDSQTSTTISQMDILGPPTSERDQRLSSISEERASALSSAIASPNNAPSVRVSFFFGVALVPWVVTDLCHRSPYNPILMSTRRTLLLALRLASAFLLLRLTLHRVCTSHPPCPATSTSSMLFHRCVSLLSSPSHGFAVYGCSSVTSNFKHLLRLAQYSWGHDQRVWYAERGGCASSTITEFQYSTTITFTSCGSGRF